MFNCERVFLAADPPAESVAACIGSVATIRAAEIQASAAWDSAITGGLLVIAAAMIAYGASVHSANRQVKHTEREHMKRVYVYAEVIFTSITRLKSFSNTAKEINFEEVRTKIIQKFWLPPMILRVNKADLEIISHERWDLHALLGVDATAIMMEVRATSGLVDIWLGQYQNSLDRAREKPEIYSDLQHVLPIEMYIIDAATKAQEVIERALKILQKYRDPSLKPYLGETRR